ncbi:hypothetical protein MMC18_001702 [Xylographa bjoerkii]|nr:hypothetical protein [Xylographa bjoerkii]
MDLQRQEYPALLTSLQPHQAVSVLNDRVKAITKVNEDIADWLLERRRVEEAYVQGLKRLASRRRQDGPASASLGVFQVPWQSIVSSTETLADSHAALAQKIEVDVERPLREYQSRNREMQGISTIQGNLAALAKELEDAQKKSDRALAKGGKADTKKVSSAISDVQGANQQWDSQAPFVFEQLQALDESRVNHLRDALTQLQTHEVDQLERSRVSAENCLNVLLNVVTADEISMFVAKNSGGSTRAPAQRASRAGSNAMPSTPAPPTPALSNRAMMTPQASYEAPIALAPPTPTPSRSVDDGRSERSATSGGPMQPPSEAVKEHRKGPLGGLRRLGTVMSRRKADPSSIERTPSPEKRSRPSRNPLRRGSSRNMQQIPSPDASTTELPTSPPREQMPMTRDAFQSQSPQPTLSPTDQRRAEPDVNGDIIEPAAPRESSLTNGNHATPRSTTEPKPRPLSTMPEEAERDSEGFSVPPLTTDDVTRAQQEALSLPSESEQPQFKLDIKSEPIREEDGDAQAALSNVANTLRAQAQVAPPQRKAGTLRGRRDVRNTIFVPNPSTPESQPVPEPGQAPMTPLNMAQARNMPADDTRGADSQSIRSSHSLSSVTPSSVRHPEMHEPGLNASIIETVSAWFSDSQVIKAVVIGELALSHNISGNVPRSGVESIRLENFPVLEKIATNNTIINQIESKSGEYTVDVSQIAHTSLAFKYQVHMEESAMAAYAPVILSPLWKVEPTQASVILNYSFNNAFVSPAKRSVSLQNVVVMITVENTKALTCLSKPAGTFSKEKNTIYWRLGNVTLDAYSEGPQRLVARFSTEGEATPGSVEARWEISAAEGLGSGLGISHASGGKEEGSDPFADEGIGGSSSGVYKAVPVVRKIMSGSATKTINSKIIGHDDITNLLPVVHILIPTRHRGEMHHHHHVRRQIDPLGFDINNDLNVLEKGVESIVSNVATLVSVVYVTATPTFKGPVGGYTTIVPVAPVQTPTVQPPSSVPTTAAEESTALEISSALVQSLIPPSSDVLRTTSASPTHSIDTSSPLLNSVQATTTPSATQGSPQPSSHSESSSNIPPVSAASATSTPVVTSQGSTGLSSGAKAGAAVGVILGLALLLLVAGLCLLHRKKQKNKAYGRAENEKDPFGDRAAAPAPARVSTPPQLNLRQSMQLRTQSEVAMSGALRNVHNLDVEKAQTAAENPFGHRAEVRANQDIPAPLRIGTATPDNIPEAAEAGAVGGAAPSIVAQRHNATKAREIKPIVAPGLRQPMEAAMPSPAGTEYSMSSLSAGPAVTSATPTNVHRIQLDFKPSMEDELELKAGQLVRLLHEYDDGWALCIRLDRSQQGVAPRTCLSARPVKPRSKPSGNAPSKNRVPARGQDGILRSMSPGPYGGGPQQTVLTPAGKPRSNSAGEIREKLNSPPGPSPMNPNAQSTTQTSEGAQGSSTSIHSVATTNDTPPKRKPDLANRNATTQPTFDFLTGAAGPPPPLSHQQSFRQSQVVKPDMGNEDLRARIKSLQYEVESYKQDRGLTTIRHEKELRDAQAKAELDFRRAQAFESSKHVTTHKYEALQKELKDLQDNSVNRQHDLDKKLRTAYEENGSLREDLEEAQTELSSVGRQQKYQLQEVENKRAALQATVNDLRSELESKTFTLQAIQEKLSQREAEVEQLESEVIELKAVTGDGGELETIRRDLTEQVNHLRKLEKTNREQITELRHLRQVHKAVEIVEEEKRALENKVRTIDDLQRQLVEAQFQRQMLEDERKSWASYLENTGGDGRNEFDSPEALARALAEERLDNASLTERLGAIQPEITEKESIINSLELERRKFQAEIEKIKGAGSSDNNRAKLRLERQKALAMKEVEYLREQLRTFDAEDVTGEVPTDAGEKIHKRIQDLESLVSQYRGELQTLHDELCKRDENHSGYDARPLKRPHEEDSDERLGELSRKNRKLQSDLTSLQQNHVLLTSELSATRSQLSSLQHTSSTRILALRSNPTDDFQNLKYSTIASLREENRALSAQLQCAAHSTKVVPISSLENARVEIAELEHTVQEKEKRMLRLKQVFAKTTTDFREAVASLLGWKMDPMPQGRFRLTSLYNPTTMDDGEDGEGGSLIFDGVSGAMKASSPEFFLEIKGLIRFWVEERKWIPGFLAGKFSLSFSLAVNLKVGHSGDVRILGADHKGAKDVKVKEDCGNGEGDHYSFRTQLLCEYCPGVVEAAS